jgi:hypothetical protein
MGIKALTGQCVESGMSDHVQEADPADQNGGPEDRGEMSLDGRFSIDNEGFGGYGENHIVPPEYVHGGVVDEEATYSDRVMEAMDVMVENDPIYEFVQSFSGLVMREPELYICDRARNRKYACAKRYMLDSSEVWLRFSDIRGPLRAAMLMAHRNVLGHLRRVYGVKNQKVSRFQTIESMVQCASVAAFFVDYTAKSYLCNDMMANSQNQTVRNSDRLASLRYALLLGTCQAVANEDVVGKRRKGPRRVPKRVNPTVALV